MKIRTGWVSNSSTSSFIIVGFKVGHDSPEMLKLKQEYYEPGHGWEHAKFAPFHILDVGYDVIIGKTIASGNMEDEVEIKFEALLASKENKHIKEAQDYLGTTKAPSVFFETIEC